MIDADGTATLGVYRKSHIPDGPGYMEKVALPARRHRLQGLGHEVRACSGTGICWDQWYPEAARAMTLDGCEVLLHPTAIGSEPHDPGAGHGCAKLAKGDAGPRGLNAVPVVGANRISLADYDGGRARILWPSFIADHRAIWSGLGEGGRRPGPRVRPAGTLPRRLGVLPRPPPRPLRAEHPLAHVPAMAHADRLTRERIRLEGGKQSQKLSVLSRLSPSSAPLPPLAPLRRGRRPSPCARYCG